MSAPSPTSWPESAHERATVPADPTPTPDATPRPGSPTRGDGARARLTIAPEVARRRLRARLIVWGAALVTGRVAVHARRVPRVRGAVGVHARAALEGTHERAAPLRAAARAGRDAVVGADGDRGRDEARDGARRPIAVDARRYPSAPARRRRPTSSTPTRPTTVVRGPTTPRPKRRPRPRRPSTVDRPPAAAPAATRRPPRPALGRSAGDAPSRPRAAAGRVQRAADPRLRRARGAGRAAAARRTAAATSSSRSTSRCTRSR